MPRLEFAPRSPFHNIEGTVAKLRQQYPGISDAGINQAVKRMLVGYKARHKGRIVHLYGADILANDLTTIPAWQWMSNGERKRVLDHPIDRGERIPPEAEGVVLRIMQEDLANRLNRSQIHRSVLISPPGLRQTYVWRDANGWIQDVLDADYHLILSTPRNRQLFRDPDIHGPFVPVRSYSHLEAKEIARTSKGGNPQKDIEYVMRHMSRTPHWQGVDLADAAD